MRIDKRKPVPELMQEIDKKFIVPESKIGKYNRLVATCQNCNLNLSGDLFNHIIGFRGIYIGNVFVCKCPKCDYVIDFPLSLGYEELQYLLSKHYDVFGLIKNNLAIEKEYLWA